MSSELFKFRAFSGGVATGLEWFLTASSENQSFGGDTYIATPEMRLDGIERGMGEGRVTIVAPDDTEPMSDYATDRNPEVILVEVRTKAGSLIASQRIVSAKFDSDDNTVTVKCSPVGSDLEGDAFVGRYTVNCRWHLGLDDGDSSQCSLVLGGLAFFQLQFTVASSVIADDVPSILNTAVGSHVDPVAGGAVANGYWTGGKVVNEDETVTIMGHTSNTLILKRPFARLAISTDLNFTITPGCDKFLATCTDKFDNLIEFGGFPNPASRNPITQGF